MHDMFQHQKVSAQVVPEQLKCCLMAMTQYTAEGKAFLNKVVTIYDSWINHYIPETKQASTDWKHATSPTKKKF
jgi:hypothetical protein